MQCASLSKKGCLFKSGWGRLAILHHERLGFQSHRKSGILSSGLRPNPTCKWTLRGAGKVSIKIHKDWKLTQSEICSEPKLILVELTCAASCDFPAALVLMEGCGMWPSTPHTANERSLQHLCCEQRPLRAMNSSVLERIAHCVCLHKQNGLIMENKGFACFPSVTPQRLRIKSAYLLDCVTLRMFGF